jgi:hypothetical protein
MAARRAPAAGRGATRHRAGARMHGGDWSGEHTTELPRVSAGPRSTMGWCAGRAPRYGSTVQKSRAPRAGTGPWARRQAREPAQRLGLCPPPAKPNGGQAPQGSLASPPVGGAQAHPGASRALKAHFKRSSSFLGRRLARRQPAPTVALPLWPRRPAPSLRRARRPRRGESLGGPAARPRPCAPLRAQPRGARRRGRRAARRRTHGAGRSGSATPGRSPTAARRPPGWPPAPSAAATRA